MEQELIQGEEQGALEADMIIVGEGELDLFARSIREACFAMRRQGFSQEEVEYSAFRGLSQFCTDSVLLGEE